jgi:MFS family permease
MSACIVSAQVVMLFCAAWAGKSAQRHGYKAILLIAFAVLPIRGLLYTLSDGKLWLLGVQLLDGVGAGIFGVLAPLALADLTGGTGRYNVASGVVATGQGIGASLSNAFAGVMTVRLGYHATFVTLAAVAALAFALLATAMPGPRRSTLAGVQP